MDIYSKNDENLLKRLSQKLESSKDCYDFPKVFLEFINRELQDEYLLLHLSCNHLFLNSILLENNKISDEDILKIKNWNGNPTAQWSISCSDTECEVSSPMDQYGSEIFCNGEPIFFLRELNGYIGYDYYYEINQKILQILNLHYIYEENAWCKFDELGELDKVIQYKKISFNNNFIHALLIKKKEFEKYCTITNQNIIRMIDITFLHNNIDIWNHKNFKNQQISQNQIYGELTIDDSNGSFFKGIQIISSTLTIQEILDEQWGNAPKQYVCLLANDIKHNKVHYISCNPDELDNYFSDTGKPLEMSIAFFKPEVLRKYKSDTEKYTINNRQISCRGGWYLRSFDINENNQIAVYLVDFNQLPYKEQLHWKQYNEEPKGFISKRAIENDFLGEFSDDIRLEEKLTCLLKELQSHNCFWWTLRSASNLSKLHSPLTGSADEWADELLNLDQLIVEGFQEKALKKYCSQYNIDVNSSDRSLKLISKILKFKKFDDEKIEEIMSVLFELHNLRSEQKGHSSGDKAVQDRKLIRKQHGDFTNHYNNLLDRIIETLNILKDELT